jgi:hypothetical protein
VPAKNGTYVVSTAGQDMSLQLSVLDVGQRVLASGPAVTLTLTAGQVYYIDLADSAGISGGYELSLSKTSFGGRGGKKAFLNAAPATDMLQMRESAHVLRGGAHRTSRACSVLAGLDQTFAAGPALIAELEPLAEADPAPAGT